MKDLFIKKSNKVHNNKYDYSEVDYINAKTKVNIICKTHGGFYQTPSKHVSGSGCFNCFKDKRYLTKEKFTKKSNLIHNNKYNYTQVDYINNRTKVKIICHIHGEFEQNPKEHMSGQGCKLCHNEKIKTKSFDIIESFNKIHNNLYDYSLLFYKNMITKVKIICHIHGEFYQLPKNHMEGKGCPICGSDKLKLHINEFKKRSHLLHYNKYNYENVTFGNTKDKSIIICPTHGEFEQEINSHLNGHGCSKCYSSKGEDKIREYLENNNIQYETQKTYDDCKNLNKLRFDFYLPEYNIIIEYDGIQHFKPVDFFGGYIGFKETKKRDYIKNDYCETNNIHLIRIPYFEDVNKILETYISIR